MSIVPRVTFSCPACNKPGQSFLSRNCLERVARTRCKGCGEQIESEMPLGMHTLLAFYQQILLYVLGVPFFIALVASTWWLVGTCAAAFLLLVVTPALMVHARNPTMKSGEHVVSYRKRKYGRKAESQ